MGQDIAWTSMNYVVGCFDLLGLSNALREFALVPSEKAEQKKLGEVMGEALLCVQNFREVFDHAVGDFRTACTDLEVANCGLPDGREALKALTDCAIREDQFSDLVVVSGRLISSEGPVTVWPALATIAGSAITMIRALASSSPFRGGIDVGVGSDWPGLELLGSALVKAHELELMAARWPRVVVGDVLISFLLSFRRAAPNASVEARLNTYFAKQARGFVCRSGDGRWMVDFLGEALARMLMARPHANVYSGAVSQAFDFVRSQVKRFRREHEDKLARRCQALERYFGARLPLWQ